MRICITCTAPENEVLVFAAGELGAYLTRMLPEQGPELTVVLGAGSCADGRESFAVDMTEKGGSITGSCPRAVLLGVYDYLRRLGCRFLGPGWQCEIVPSVGWEKLAARYEKRASFCHRGVCIEGADSRENVLEFIDWLPKVGYNSFFLQFKNPYAFLKRWYRHERNPLKRPELYTVPDAERDMELFEAALRKRGLLLHTAGHGWTGEVLGYETLSWASDSAPLTEEKRHLAAQTGGVRNLWQGVPANTNLCFSEPRSVQALAALVVEYAKNEPAADYIHVWLADTFNNVCECDACQKTTLSDQYAAVLNEIDRRLTAAGLGTRIVFLLYQELLWPPVRERLENPERFVLMFAPISRTFEASYDLEGPEKAIPPYERNRITLPADLGENLAFLRGWQRIFHGDSFVYDYPLGRAHYGDLGYVHIARVIGRDIKKLPQMGLDGYISCQELRASLPNSLPNYVMGYTLFDREADTQGLITEYFQAAYGEDWERARDHLEELSRLNSCDYLNGKGDRVNPDIARRMAALQEVCRSFAPVADARQGKGLYWELLAYHQRYAMGLARAMELLALGQEREGCAAWRALCGMICENEPKYQPYLDVYRVQEVTENYTGFCGLEAGERNSMRHEYYYYSKEQLLASPRLPITVMADNAAVFQTMAREMADEIKRKNALGEKTVFICPVGPVGQYPYFVDMVNKENISLKNVWFLNMDEYLTDDKAWISKDHPLSFRGFMDRKVYTKIKPELVMPEEQRIFPDPKDPENMWRTIQALGGVDICFGGIGINGHVAFNEAQDELTADQFRALPTRVLAISRETRTANAIGDFNGAVDDMPRWCVTIGMREICSAKKIRLGCFRDWHRAVVRYACCGEVSAHFPVTLLQEHPDTLLRVTEFVANLPE